MRGATRSGLPVGQQWSNDRQRAGHPDTGETLDPAGNPPSMSRS
ncbi:hypothetical protein SNL152K_2463 [Streptomyces sp. NL15-2K]|nr:hypothetical protein SNL152K_2463 [Streptomyces sp. NL15-2K]